MEHSMDPCLFYLKETEELLNGYKDLSTYQMLFESEEDEKINETVKNNQVIEEKTTSTLKKACQAIQELIKSIINKIKDFVAKATMSKEDKEKYDAFMAKLSNDPQLKNKKVSVTDWKKINAAYDEALKEIEAEIQNNKNLSDAEAEARANEVISNIKKKLGKVASAAVTVVGVDTARKIADSSKESAKMMEKLLGEESVVMTHLENTIGEKGAKKFKKDVKSAGRLISLRRFKVWILNKKYNSARDCFYGTINEIKKISSGNVSAIANSDMVKDTARVVNPDQDPNVTIAKAGTKAASIAVKAANTKRKIDKGKEKAEKMKNFWS